MSPETERIEVILVGCHGRMGRAVHAVAACDQACNIVGDIDHDHQELAPDLNDAVMIDFSSNEGTKVAINLAHELRTPILIGTTALEQDTLEAVQALSTHVPVALVANTSLGIAILQHLVRTAGSLLSELTSVSAELSETHHLEKRDAPSGTSIFLAKTLSTAGINMPLEAIESIRTGEVVGNHELRLCLGHETLVLAHQALDRRLFAEGAIHLARRLSKCPPGLHGASDLLGLS